MRLVKLLSVAAIIVFFLSAAYRVGAETPIVTGSGFNTVIESGDSLAFQTDDTITFDVDSGTLNGTSCSLGLYRYHGRFSFYAEANATLIASVDREEVIGFSCEGATFVETDEINTFIVTVPEVTSVSIAWFYRLPSYVDMYTQTAIGLGGIFLMIFSPTWVAWKFKKEGASTGSVERFGYGMLLFIVGFGLVVMWLMG